MKISIIVLLLIIINSLTANPPNNREFSNSILGGLNYTFVNDYDTSPRFNYSFGVLISSKYTEKVSLNYLILYSKTSSFIKTLSDKSYNSNDLKSYKNYYDLEFKESFFNFNILGNYQIYQDVNININGGLGLGFLMFLSDNSKVKNLTITDEVIYVYSSEPVDEYNPDPTYWKENSGFNFCSNLTFSYSRINLTIFYRFTFYRVKDLIYKDKLVDRLNTVSLLLGYSL